LGCIGVVRIEVRRRPSPTLAAISIWAARLAPSEVAAIPALPYSTGSYRGLAMGCAAKTGAPIESDAIKALWALPFRAILTAHREFALAIKQGEDACCVGF